MKKYILLLTMFYISSCAYAMKQCSNDDMCDLNNIIQQQKNQNKRKGNFEDDKLCKFAEPQKKQKKEEKYDPLDTNQILTLSPDTQKQLFWNQQYDSKVMGFNNQKSSGLNDQENQEGGSSYINAVLSLSSQYPGIDGNPSFQAIITTIEDENRANQVLTELLHDAHREKTNQKIVFEQTISNLKQQNQNLQAILEQEQPDIAKLQQQHQQEINELKQKQKNTSKSLKDLLKELSSSN